MWNIFSNSGSQRHSLCFVNRIYNRRPYHFSYPRNLSEDGQKVFHVSEVNTGKTPITSLLWDRRKNFNKTDSAEPGAVVHAREDEKHSIVEKLSKDSSFMVPYDFSSDVTLRDAYADARGSILLGTLFEDLDAFAGNIAFLHVHNEKKKSNGPSLVTASVDKIALEPRRKKISVSKDDLLLCGQVAWVGKSSLDIIMEIHDGNEVSKYSSEGLPAIYEEKGNSSRLLSSIFTFVARDRSTGKATAINKYKPFTEAEIDLFNKREELASHRKLKTTTMKISHDVLQSLVERGCAVEDMPAIAHPNAVLMRNTALENSFICQPQNGNTAGRVFGGFLMHRAYDLALATCYTFAGCYPQFKEVDKVVFKRPVDIGDLVRLKSRIVYTTDNPIKPIAAVEVTCQIVRPEKASSFVSNTFNFEFCFDESVNLRRVLPVNYEEATTIVHASRSILQDEFHV